MFKNAVTKSQSDDIRAELDHVVNLDKMDYENWSVFIHFVDKQIRDKQAEQQKIKSLEAQLVKAKLKDLRYKVNQSKEQKENNTFQMVMISHIVPQQGVVHCQTRGLI